MKCLLFWSISMAKRKREIKWRKNASSARTSSSMIKWKELINILDFKAWCFFIFFRTCKMRSRKNAQKCKKWPFLGAGTVIVSMEEAEGKEKRLPVQFSCRIQTTIGFGFILSDFSFCSPSLWDCAAPTVWLALTMQSRVACTIVGRWQ